MVCLTATEWIIVILCVAGGFFSLTSAIGIIRLPDVFCRLHATGKNSTAGVILIMTATFLYFLIERDMLIWKLFLTIIFVFLTVPVAALIISRSAYRIGVKLDSSSVIDEMRPHYDEERSRFKKRDTAKDNSEKE